MKTKQTFISVNLPTDYTHESGNRLEEAKQQIELSSFYLQSLFNSIKHSAAHLESYFDGQGQEFCNDLHNIAEIGYSVSGSIFASLSVFETDKPETPESEAAVDAESETREPKTDLSVAEMLSFLITSEQVPTFISDGVSYLMLEFFNEEVDQTDFIRETHSPEYIERLLQNHRSDE